jgi:HD-like signal output (HDOD) protein
MDCFIAGLLHDFGKVVFAQYMSQEFRQALQISQLNQSSLHVALTELIGADHSVVGAMLVEKWRFPADLIETIRHQHTPELMDTPMIACVFAANQISKKLAFGFGGNAYIDELPPSIVQRLDGTLDDVILSLGDLSGVFEDARLFSKV